MKPISSNPVTLRNFDPAAGGLPFALEALDRETLAAPVRSNCFTILWVREGEGRYHPDLMEHPFAGPVLLFANPYQTLFLKPESAISGTLMRFHANFLCIETHHKEVGCNGVLFNRLHGEPMVRCDPALARDVGTLVGQIEEEFTAGDVAHREAVLSLVKILLIKASRMKLEQMAAASTPGKAASHPVLVSLLELIERDFHRIHRPHEYAARLGMTPKALGRLVKEELGKTPTELIRDRMLKHAKWHLLHTLRPVKEIAAEAGFMDEFYFSRLFKSATGFSPTAFREFETRIRNGSNLSM
ncbi:helix-turn-helix transcriptional regulator [Luteolibacter sp. SL250]|uniref:helix-turn-helix domain-containing protein n=1 Tax=Luteolibacter sp. SL250 TaxID=2995170 RepID=UPI00226EF145|nr:AraC family transcriptional regulator [Luteolibacter sp. SL250]WAC18323.1 helix-turn-helix transcriptional regulator [Luteolibacter sp. SL250]